MTTNLSRRSLLALGAGLGASTMLGGSALAKAPKLNTQTPTGTASFSVTPK